MKSLVNLFTRFCSFGNSGSWLQRRTGIVREAVCRIVYQIVV